MPTRRFATARWKLPIIVGTALLAIAAFKPVWTWHGDAKIVVMVDLSPSTRGAAYRQAQTLQHFIATAIGNQPYQLIFFADHNEPGSLDAASQLADLPCDRTHFDPPAADAVLLFSDGQFAPPAAAPPVYPFLDPALATQTDAAIADMEIRGNNVAVTVRNNGPPRQLTVEGKTFRVTGPQTFLIPVTIPGNITATLSPGDAWPENDSLSISPTPPLHRQRWWIGDDAPRGDWRILRPADLAALEPSDFLAPSVIVLNDIPATDLRPLAADHLETYVRDLGGTLLILGGPHAFAAGDYDGSVLGDLSPLASSPPQPTLRWLLLADFSGSMANDNLWSRAASAIVSVVPHLPPHDPVFIGQFAESLRWWSAGQSAAYTSHLDLPPRDALPHGPTNLEAVLDSIIRDTNSPLQSQLLLVTDADVTFDHPDGVTAGLKAKNIHLHLLAIAHGRGLGTLTRIATATGGSVLTQFDPAQWPATAQKLLAAALPPRWNAMPVTVHFTGPAIFLGKVMTSHWNRTWLVPHATALNQGDVPMTAMRRFGLGQVIAAAFYAPALAPLFAEPPSDPRFKIAWQSGDQLNLSVDAENAGQFLNNLPLRLHLSGRTVIIPQTGPGEYSLTLPAPRSATVATVTLKNRSLDMHALPSRYPSEFDQIGLNRAALHSLAQATGGKLVPPDQATPLSFVGPPHQYDLMPWLSAAGATLIAMGLVAWKQKF